MFLKALEIQGFKSFPDRTRIHFDRGITAVVGPNGSGKSNISDAIRWVLGETSAKQLRGGGKMENVIFGGTQSRSAMGFASVNLIVDNSDRRIDVDADEVTIGRKYYRSGESEYSINGQSVRLKDVYELLLDTGLGRDGYSIIGQGRIAEIVGAKSDERREIFEEASGIARFRYRKNEAERRLVAAEENLVRLRDILGELEARVGPLEQDSIKAKKFLEYAGEKKSLEVTLWVDTVRTSRESLRGHQRLVETAQGDYDAKGREIDAIDEETAGIRAEIERTIMEIEKANSDIRALQEEIAGRDSSIAVLKNNIAHNHTSIATHREEIAQSGAAASEIETDIQRHIELIEAAEGRQKESNERIAALEAELAEMQAKSLASGEERGHLQAEITEMTTRTTSLQVAEAAATAALAAAEARLAESEAAQDGAKETLAKRREESEQAQKALAAIEENIARLTNIQNGLDMKLQSRNALYLQAQDRAADLTRQAESAKQRIAMLRELENSLDGFQSSVKNVINASRHGKLRGVIGPVSSILSVKAGYEVAIETALGFSLQNVVVQDESAAKAAMAYLKQTNGGRATFLPLDTVKPQTAPRLPDGAVCAQTLVGYDKQYENIVSSLLARIVVVEDINDASRTAKALDYRNRVVTRDGQVINAGGSFTGGSVSRSAGLFSRKQEMDDLTAQVQAMAEKHKAAAEETARLKAEVDKLQAELTATLGEVTTAKEDAIRAKAEADNLFATCESAALAQQKLAEDFERFNIQIKTAKAEATAAKQEHIRLSAEIDKLTTALTAVAGKDDGYLANRETLVARLSELRLAELAHRQDAELHRQSIETLKSRTGESEARRALLEANIAQLEEQNRSFEGDILEVSRRAEESKERISAIEESIRDMTQSRLQKEGEIRGQTDRERAVTAEREELGREIARLTEQKSALEAKYDSTISQLWEEYELTLTDAEALCVEFTSASELRRRVNELRGKIRSLGNVNVGAIEEYEEVFARYTFLKAQVGDVEESKAGLEKLIAELAAEMTTLFEASFSEINRHFGRIFSELFGGGKAALNLSDPSDLLGSGIEIEVAPPGKIIKDLAALSGGEQALVAICIYFAILAVNPAPFCVLDEIEAALDDVNVVRFARYLRRIVNRTQFIIITHRRGTMEEADVLYGVTMQEDGVSKLLRLNVAEVDASLVR